MAVDLGTFLVALSTIVEELARQRVAPPRPVLSEAAGAVGSGRCCRKRPVLSDSEVVMLVGCAQWHGRSERRFPRLVARD